MQPAADAPIAREAPRPAGAPARPRRPIRGAVQHRPVRQGPARPGRVPLRHHAPGLRRLPDDQRRGGRGGPDVRPASGPRHRLRRRDLDRRAHHGRRGRRHHRPVPDEPGPRGERGGPDRDRRGRGDPQAVECGDRGHRALLPRRPGRRRHARRHGRHPRVGLQCRPLRHDARERPRPEGRHGRRRGHPHGPPREEVVGGVRPHADLRRERGDARHHHRGHGPALPPARGRVGRGLPLPGRRGRGRTRSSGRSSGASRSRAPSCSTR